MVFHQYKSQLLGKTALLESIPLNEKENLTICETANPASKRPHLFENDKQCR